MTISIICTRINSSNSSKSTMATVANLAASGKWPNNWRVNISVHNLSRGTPRKISHSNKSGSLQKSPNQTKPSLGPRKSSRLDKKRSYCSKRNSRKSLSARSSPEAYQSNPQALLNATLASKPLQLPHSSYMRWVRATTISSSNRS